MIKFNWKPKIQYLKKLYLKFTHRELILNKLQLPPTLTSQTTTASASIITKPNYQQQVLFSFFLRENGNHPYLVLHLPCSWKLWSFFTWKKGKRKMWSLATRKCQIKSYLRSLNNWGMGECWDFEIYLYP